MVELWQQKALAIMPKCTAGLSILGSAFVLQDILKDPIKRQRTYGRILLGISSFDMLVSAGCFLSTWPIPGPPDTFPLYSAGNQQTCVAQGFLLQLSVAQPIYSVGLCLYYLCVMVYRMPDNVVRQKLERPLHCLACSVAIGTAIAGIPLKLFNNATLWCWIGSVPAGCVDGVVKGGSGVDAPQCERGKYAYIYRWAFYYAIVFFCFVFIALCMGAVTYSVHSVEKASRKYRQQPNPNSVASGGDEASVADNSAASGKLSKMASWRKRNSQHSSKKVNRHDKIRQLSSKVFWQSFHYVLVFYITWIFAVTTRTLQTLGKPIPIQIILCMAFFIPLQGFFTFSVYIRPRVLNYREKHPDANLFYLYYQAMTTTLTKKIIKTTTKRISSGQPTTGPTGQDLLIRKSQMPIVSELDGIKSNSCYEQQQENNHETTSGSGVGGRTTPLDPIPVATTTEDHQVKGGNDEDAPNHHDSKTVSTGLTTSEADDGDAMDANIMDPAYTLVATLRSSARLYQREHKRRQHADGDPNAPDDANDNHDVAFERFLKEFGEDADGDNIIDHEGDNNNNNNRRTGGRRTFGQSLRQSLRKFQGSLTSSSTSPPAAAAVQVPPSGIIQEETCLQEEEDLPPLPQEKKESSSQRLELSQEAPAKEMTPTPEPEDSPRGELLDHNKI